jgi:hypothetical protein
VLIAMIGIGLAVLGLLGLRRGVPE